MGASADRVVVTGIGPVTSIGIGRRAFWDAAIHGHSGGRALALAPEILATIGSRIGAPVQGFDPVAFGIPQKDLEILDPGARFALAAARLALEDAGFATTLLDRRKGRSTIADIDPERVAVVLGTGIGGLTTVEASHRNWTTTYDRSRCKRYSLPMLIPNAPAAQVAIRFGAQGECKTVATACASGTMAIGDAWRLLVAGEADLALAGGSEALLSESAGYALIGFDLLRTLTTRNDDPARASRPWDKDRDGFLLGEGACVLALERESFARARGARIYARLDGYATNCDAYSMMMLEPDGRRIAAMVRTLMERSGAVPADIDYINAHGTSTVPGDLVETRVFKDVFGPHAASLAISSTKSMTGHAVAASGAIEAAASVLAIAHGTIPPTINLDQPGPECDLDYVPNVARPARVRTAISTSYGFGGHNAALLFREP